MSVRVWTVEELDQVHPLPDGWRWVEEDLAWTATWHGLTGRRKIEARDGALHFGPMRRRKPGSRGRALIRALQKQQRARFVHDVELAMLCGDPK